MVLTSAEAITLTNNAVQVQTQNEVNQEISLAEQSIRNASSRQQFKILYNARIVGNPAGDPQDDDKLTPAQIDFRDAFVGAGYAVTLDEDTELWRISWESTGAEALVGVYSIRTTVTPGPVQAQTIVVVDNYFKTLTPVARARTVLVNPVGSGGDVDESQFGAPASTFYEYLAIVQQPTPDDHSSALQAALVASGLGYSGAGPDNLQVYKVA